MTFSIFTAWVALGCAGVACVAMLVEILAEARHKARERRRRLAVRRWVRSQPGQAQQEEASA